MASETPDDLIQKYHEGKLSPEELHRLNKWFHSFDDTSTSVTTSELELKMRILQSAQRRIAQQEKRPRTGIFREYLRLAAAVLVLVIAGATIYFKRTAIQDVLDPVVYKETHAPVGAVQQITLADGTRVWLNARSSLRYPERFNRGRREVFVQGEAYLEVKEDLKKPFIVHLDNLDVRVTGTAFQVKNYSDDEYTAVALQSGSVMVSSPLGSNTNGNIAEHLTPNQQLLFHKPTAAIQRTTVNTRNNVRWKEGELKFENIPLSEIAKVLGRWYGARFILQGDGLADCRLKINLTGVPLSEALRIISELTGTKYFRKGQTIEFIGKGCN